MSVPPPIPVVISNIKPLALPDAPRAEQAALTTIHELDPHAINLGAGAQMRVKLNKAVVDDYAEAMEREEIFPMPIVYAATISDEGEPISEPILADGFHRIVAARRAGLTTLAVELRQGGRREAILHAVKANAEHGLRLTNADKRKAVSTLLEDEEWRCWSDREISRRTGTSHVFVGNIRKDLGADESERRYLRNGEERTYTVKDAPAEEVDAAAGLFASDLPKKPASRLPPFPNGSPVVPRADAAGEGQKHALPVSGALKMLETPRPTEQWAEAPDMRPQLAGAEVAYVAPEPLDPIPSSTLTTTHGAGDPLVTVEAAPYERARAASPAPIEPPRRRVYPAIVDVERGLDPTTRHVLRRWVWTHGTSEGLPSIARLSDLPPDLDGNEDGDAPAWVDLDMHLGKLVGKGLLLRSGNGTLAAPRSLYNVYTNADRRMRHVQVRQDDWVFRRGDEISEQLGADRIDYIIPVGGESAAIKLCFGEFGEEHTELFFNGDAGEPTREHGRTYEQPLARMEALVKAMKGVK